MSQRALTLPLRTRALRPAWVCRRCLATQPDAAPSTSSSTDLPDAFDAAAQSKGAAQNPPTEQTGSPRDRFLARRLPHHIPPQYLQHSTSNDLNAEEKKDRDAMETHKEIRGVVVSAGLMDKTVRVRVPGRRWNRKIGKYFASYTQHLVHDPNNSLIVGDVIQLHRLKVSSQVFHVVGAITAPFGKPISERPPIPTPDERLSKYKEMRFAKLERRALRQKAAAGGEEAIKKLQSMGLDPGKGVGEKDVGKKAGAVKDEKGQKLPKGDINERAKRNKESAMKLNEQAEANLLDAKEKEDALREQGLSADGELPKKSSVGESQVQ